LRLASSGRAKINYEIEYENSRARGFARWRPTKRTLERLPHLIDVVEEYRDQWPITSRQILYRLIALDLGFKKDDIDWVERVVNRGRRANLIPWRAIEDGRSIRSSPFEVTRKAEFRDWLSDVIDTQVQIDRQRGQGQVVELWVEAQGMVPQARRIAHQYGVSVYSSGGDTTVSARHSAFERIERRLADEKRGTVILHVGDLDPDGVALFNVIRKDIGQFILDSGVCPTHDEARRALTVVRTAITHEQIDRYGISSQRVKRRKRMPHYPWDITVQVEALAPDQLADELRTAITEWIDQDVLDATIETRLRGELHLGVTTGFGPALGK